MSDWLKIIAGVLLLAIACFKCCPTASVQTGTATTAVAPLANVPANFEAHLQGGKVVLNGLLPNDEAKTRLLARAREVFGADGFTDNTLKVSGPGVGNVQAGAGWLDWALGLLAIPKKLTGDNAGITLGPQTVTVRGVLPDQPTRSRLLQDVTALLPGSVTLNDLTTVAGNTLSDAQLKAQSDLNQLLIQGIEFATGKADISTAGAATLDQVANALKAVPDVKVEIGGHTDNVGQLPANNALSQARAASVRKFLADQGIAADRVSAKGYGPSQPIADNTSDTGRQRNRRIEFRVIGGGGAVQAR